MTPEPTQPEDGVPRILHSVQAGAPFQKCVDCGGSLLHSGLPYAVEKVVRQGEVIFEYAICTPCTFNLMREFSEESLQRLADYLRTEARPWDAEALDLFLRTLDGDPDPEPVVPPGENPDHCHRCGSAGDPFQEEHTVVGMLLGQRLITGVSTVCAHCTEGMEELLSRKTRDVHDHFIESRFPGVPANLDIPAGVFGL